MTYKGCFRATQSFFTSSTEFEKILCNSELNYGFGILTCADRDVATMLISLIGE